MGTMINRRRVMGGGNLPYDCEVEYLQTDGLAFIDTGIKASSNLTFDINIYFPNHNNAFWCFGARISSSIGQLAFLNDVPTNRKYWRFGSKQISKPDPLASGTYNFNNTSNSYTLKINNSISFIAQEQTFTTNNNFYLLTLNINGTPATGIVNGTRILPSKIYLSGVLVRDYIAVRKDGVGYLYDKVSGELFGNANSEGSFSYGADKN